jgi:hypothetical protein
MTQMAFEKLKRAMVSSSVLELPNLSKPLEVHYQNCQNNSDIIWSEEWGEELRSDEWWVRSEEKSWERAAGRMI